MMPPYLRSKSALALFSVIVASLCTASSQTTAFTYQGRLVDGGNPANGVFALQFAVYDAPINGTQFGGTLSITNNPVTNGLLTATLDFGGGVFTGPDRWLQIGVRPDGSTNAFAVLLPRQALTPTPYAIYAALAGGVPNGTISSGQLAPNAVGAVNVQSNAITGSKIAPGQVVKSLNGLRDDVVVVPGAGLSLNTSGNVLQLAADVGSYWNVNGNSGTTSNQFLGTTDNKPLEFRVNNARALRLEPTTNSPNVIGGFAGNVVGGGALGATIGGGGQSGLENTVSASFGVVGGGRGNAILQGATRSTISGGALNTNSSSEATISGGVNNNIQSNSKYTTIGGGEGNSIGTNGNDSTIAGGAHNSIQVGAIDTAIGGGWSNSIGSNSFSGVIGGGSFNAIAANAPAGTIAGGRNNAIAANAYRSTIGGGVSNTNNSQQATIGGGANNTVGTNAQNATIAGGTGNLASANNTSIAGGNANTASGDTSTVGGGYLNKASGPGSFIGGGNENQATNFDSAVSGGFQNTASGETAFVGGGQLNVASGLRAAIGGGLANLASGYISFIGAGNANTTYQASFIGAGALNFADQNSVIGGGLENLATNTSGVLGGFKNKASGETAFVGAGYFNVASGFRAGAGGGQYNVASGTMAFVGGGDGNQATNLDSAVCGGSQNVASGETAFIGGGYLNSASGFRAAIAGGYNNTASGQFATIPGGYKNVASNDFSFAAGRRAKANHSGAFVWADSTDADVSSTTNNQFAVRASGGVIFYSDPTATFGVSLPPGSGAFSSLSDRNSKANLEPVDGSSVLERLSAMPIATWNYKSQADSIRHMGPMAQDFAAAFGVGEDARHINTVDADGVALAAIQGLNQKVEALTGEIKRRDAENAELKQRLDKLEQWINQTKGGSK